MTSGLTHHLDMERLMQYVWQFRLIPHTALTTVDGRRVSIINPGSINTDAGPDFFNADIIIDGQQWVGNVEIHVKASDWYHHGHHNDRAYDSVILHIVRIDDTPVYRPDGQLIPQLRLDCATDLNARYTALTVPAPTDLSCAPPLSSINPVYIRDWITSLAIQRLQSKADRIIDITDSLGGDWAAAAYITIARALGFGKNSEPFERLARATPLSFLRKHIDDRQAIESMIFGQAGYLNLSSTPDNNPYRRALSDEYQFYRAKFSLTPPPSLNIKTGRLRPQNSPCRRLALLAAMVCGFQMSPLHIVQCLDIASMRQLLRCQPSTFWLRHYTFDSAPTPSDISVSDASLDLIIINALLPIAYAWGHAMCDHNVTQRAIDLLSQLSPESNSLVSMFVDNGIPCHSALDSQGIIHLRKEYCQQRQCLNCRIGHRILSRAAVPSSQPV